MAKDVDKHNPDKITGGFLEARNQDHRSPIVVVGPKLRSLSDAEGDGEKPKTHRVRKTKLAIMGIPKSILSKGDPRYTNALVMAAKYRKVRAAELARLHGYVSTGASAILATASLALAASRFLYEKVAETGDLSLLKTAANLGESARQGELAAWELSAREGLVMRKQAAGSAAAPWMTQEAQEDGKMKSGRKTNAERAERNLVAPPVPLTGPQTMTIDEILTISRKESNDEHEKGAASVEDVRETATKGHA